MVQKAEQAGTIPLLGGAAVMDTYRSIVAAVTEVHYEVIEPNVDLSKRRSIEAQRTTIFDGEWHWDRPEERLVIEFSPVVSSSKMTGDVFVEVFPKGAKQSRINMAHPRREDIEPLWSRKLLGTMSVGEREKALAEFKDFLRNSSNAA